MITQLRLLRRGLQGTCTGRGSGSRMLSQVLIPMDACGKQRAKRRKPGLRRDPSVPGPERRMAPYSGAGLGMCGDLGTTCAAH